MRKPLTNRQQLLYAKIREYAVAHDGETPTMAHLKGEMELNSVATVSQHLAALEQKGYIRRRKHAKRNHIILLDSQSSSNTVTTRPVRVVGSVGCDDLSVYASELFDETIEVDNLLLDKHKGPYVAVRAIGRSMSDAGIEDGDYVLVEQTNDAKNGDTVLAIVGDMATVKLLDRRDGMTILRPMSREGNYKPIVLREDFRIQGKVLCTIPGDSMDVTEVVYDRAFGRQ